MGCIDSKEKSSLNTLKFHCDELMSNNLLCLLVIQYLLIQKNQICQALRIISLLKSTENYYSIIVQYRNFWVYQAKKHEKNDPSHKSYINCQKEQQKEYIQLKNANEVLEYSVSSLHPNWQDTFSDLKAFKSYLETSKSVVEQSSSLYGSYYTEDKKHLKKVALEYSHNIQEFDSQLYKDIKEVTVNRYKIPENRVYFTPKIIHKKLNTIENLKDDERDELINNLKSFEAQKSLNLLDCSSDILENITEKIDLESVSSN